MGYGLEVKNDSYYIQLDGENPILSLATSGTVPVNYTGGGTVVTGYGLNSPILAVGGTGWIVNVTNSGTTYTWTIMASGEYVDYYIYDIAAGIPPAGGIGLEVFGPSGALVYSSAVKPLRLLANINAPAEFTGTFASYPGRRLATIQVSQPPVRSETVYSNSQAEGYYDATTSEYGGAPSTAPLSQAADGQVVSGDGGFAYSYRPEEGRGSPPNTYIYYYGNWDFWVIDVT